MVGGAMRKIDKPEDAIPHEKVQVQITMQDSITNIERCFDAEGPYKQFFTVAETAQIARAYADAVYQVSAGNVLGCRIAEENIKKWDKLFDEWEKQ